MGAKVRFFFDICKRKVKKCSEPKCVPSLNHPSTILVSLLFEEGRGGIYFGCSLLVKIA